MKSGSTSLLSVGIDVGTTSTHLTLNRLHLGNQSRFNEPSRFAIQEREVCYQSPVYFTPLTDSGIVDGMGVKAIIQREYENAGIQAAEVDTGAVIVTGETAKKRNAGDVAKALSELSGQFVVASAGPNLESVLAARGSGAAEASRQRGTTICNIDIGGGTANIAVFRSGTLLSTSCLAVGGRFLRLTRNLEVRDVTDTGRTILENVGVQCCPDIGIPNLTGEAIALIARRAAQVVVAVGCGAGQCDSNLIDKLLTTASPVIEGRIDEYWFSGGIAELMARPVADKTQFSDLGGFLAQSLVDILNEHRLPYFIPANPIRATVIGAGMHSLQLSGSTLSVESDSLPLPNLPIIRPLLEGAAAGSASWQEISAMLRVRIAACLNQNDICWSEQPIALFLPNLSRMDYNGLNNWARALANVVEEFCAIEPIVILCTHDVAAALGQQMRQWSPGKRHIVLDGIEDAVGEFIDIGAPLANRQAVPVVLKELLFA